MRIVCQQTILMKYHALFVIFEKAEKILNCRLLQNTGGALRVQNRNSKRVLQSYLLLLFGTAHMIWVLVSREDSDKRYILVISLSKTLSVFSAICKTFLLKKISSRTSFSNSE